jgi:hypothetical protein
MFPRHTYEDVTIEKPYEVRTIGVLSHVIVYDETPIIHFLFRDIAEMVCTALNTAFFLGKQRQKTISLYED